MCAQGVIIEVKAKAALQNEDLVQAINTQSRLNRRDGLLLNFGSASLQYKHIFNNDTRPETQFEDITPELVGENKDDLFESRHYLPDWLIQKMQQDKNRKKSH